MNRRGFLGLLGGAAAAIAVPELWVPEKTIFLPPVGGWVAKKGNTLLTLDLITREALRVLENKMVFVTGNPSFSANTSIAPRMSIRYGSG